MSGKSAYDRWLRFIAYGARTGEIFPRDEAIAIMALPAFSNWRRDKREINKAARKARAARIAIGGGIGPT